MQPKLTIQERLKDLRVERGLTLEQLSAETGISRSALGKYEADDFKDISPFSMVELAKFYGVSTDYLLGLTEQKNHPNTELDALHLGDDAIEVLKTGKFNHRLLSELICHKDFQRFMLDAEIYVDRIADMRVNDMNAVLEAVRQMALMKNGGEENDLHLRTLEVAQIREDEYFGSLIADDLKGILRDIREQHRPDTMTADESSLVATVQGQLQDAMNFEGSSEEKQVRSFLATFGIDYDKLTKEQFVSLIEILKLSKYLKSPISQRGKARPQLSHGKGKKNANKEKSAPAFEAGADFCYPIMRLNFWRKWRKFGVNPLFRIQKIKQFQGFAVSLSTCRPLVHYFYHITKKSDLFEYLLKKNGFANIFVNNIFPFFTHST